MIEILEKREEIKKLQLFVPIRVVVQSIFVFFCVSILISFMVGSGSMESSGMMALFVLQPIFAVLPFWAPLTLVALIFSLFTQPKLFVQRFYADTTLVVIFSIVLFFSSTAFNSFFLLEAGNSSSYWPYLIALVVSLFCGIWINRHFQINNAKFN